MIVFSIVLIAIIGIGTKFFLPTYYLRKQLDFLETSKTSIRSAYEIEDLDTVIFHMEEMENELGGELYYFDEAKGKQGYAASKGMNRINNSNSEIFKPEGEITVYHYINKTGLDIQVIGVLIGNNYLVYEVSIFSLNKVTDTMMDFILIVMAIAMFLAVVFSFGLSRNLAKPISKLNELAESMKKKEIDPYMVSDNKDEIWKLNQTLNELYEELRGNIYKLDAELNKERNAEQLKKRFLAQATHELKTPIAVIRGYAEILYDGMYKNEDERDQYLKNIYEETESVSHLILDVLDYTKMETGNYKIKLQELSMKTYVIDLCERYREYIEKNNVKFVFEENIPASFLKRMDKDRFDQVYKNLISNAVEHAKSKIITNVAIVGDKLKLSVYNDGINISEEDFPNVFESFYKRKGKRKGSGLGLAVVKEIILLHHGEYRVENKEDGVKFIVII